MLSKWLPKFAIVLLTVQLSSCATLPFKQNNYDEQTRVYSNYEMNYSVKVPENYSFVEKSDNLDPISKQLFTEPGGNVDIILSYKHYPIFFAFMVEKETFSDDILEFVDESYRGKDGISELMSSLANQATFKKTLKAGIDSRLKKMNLIPTSIDISSKSEYLIISVISENKILDIHLNLALTYFKQNQSSNDYYTFTVVGFNFPASTSIAHEDLSKILKEVELGTYLPKDRYKNK